MNAKKITLILIPINIILAFFVYDSISSEVEFNKLAKERIAENVQKLKDLRTLQIAYKRENEVSPMDLRPHPYEFHLYYDA